MKKTTSFSGGVTGLSIATYLIIFSLVSIWTDRNLDFWVSFFKGSEVNIPWWLSLLVSWLLNAIIFGLNIIAELVRFVI